MEVLYHGYRSLGNGPNRMILLESVQGMSSQEMTTPFLTLSHWTELRVRICKEECISSQVISSMCMFPFVFQLNQQPLVDRPSIQFVIDSRKVVRPFLLSLRFLIFYSL